MTLENKIVVWIANNDFWLFSTKWEGEERNYDKVTGANSSCVLTTKESSATLEMVSIGELIDFNFKAE